jgi:hypothetical protein
MRTEQDGKRYPLGQDRIGERSLEAKVGAVCHPRSPHVLPDNRDVAGN